MLVFLLIIALFHQPFPCFPETSFSGKQILKSRMWWWLKCNKMFLSSDRGLRLRRAACLLSDVELLQILSERQDPLKNWTAFYEAFSSGRHISAALGWHFNIRKVLSLQYFKQANWESSIRRVWSKNLTSASTFLWIFMDCQFSNECWFRDVWKCMRRNV